MTVLPPDLLYPVTKEDCWSGRLFDLAFWEQATRRAYAVHYWEGTWFRGVAGRGAGFGAALPRQVAAVVTDGRPESARSPLANAEGAKAEGLPLISCLMVTRGRRALLEFAIDGFARQTYPNRELVIVCDSPALPQDDPLERLARTAWGEARGGPTPALHPPHQCRGGLLRVGPLRSPGFRVYSQRG